MTTITVYDDTYQRLDKLAEDLDVTIAEVIDTLMDYESDIRTDNKDWISAVNSTERV